MSVAQGAGAPPNVEIKVRLPENVAANLMRAATMLTAWELIHSDIVTAVKDFIVAVAGTGSVVARVITNPPHMKRVLAALQDNMKKYESVFGAIRTGPEPTIKVGFHPSDEARA